MGSTPRSTRSNVQEAIMLGLTSLGAVHTLISLVAVVAGFASLLRDGRISPSSGLGRTYLVATVLTCLTALGIFQHGGFGKPHALAIITLVMLALAATAGRTSLFGRAGRYVETIAYSATLFFHMVPAVTETATRLPPGAPWATGPDDPLVQGLSGAFFVVFLIGAIWQARVLHGLRTRS
jgi:hypothetical protein